MSVDASGHVCIRIDGSAYPGSPEGLVDGPEPAHVRAGGEHEEPDDRQSEVCYAAAAEHPHEAANQIHRKGGGINWKHMCGISDSGCDSLPHSPLHSC